MPVAGLVCSVLSINKDQKMWKYFYDETGEIAMYSEVHPGADVPDMPGFEVYVSDQQLDVSTTKIDPVTKQPVSKPPRTRQAPTTNWSSQRNYEYGTAEQQLGLLYDDIASGVFGESAKQSQWFQHITAVKQANPKQ